ncbi:uncharacterized protein LOC141657175 [Silene latifolia]|uniref:uncharacterized protein LOC141657175 n=1 Tax=Silene latifolia TaxID=37657 RepID=UPI003D7796A5
MISRRWCSSCMMKNMAYPTDLGYICCSRCGKVLDDNLFIEEPQFGKNGDWQNLVHVSFERAVASEDSASRERPLNKGLENLTLTEDLHSNSSGQRNADGGPGTSPGLSCLNHSKRDRDSS